MLLDIRHPAAWQFGSELPVGDMVVAVAVAVGVVVLEV
jgi:hypothetical protein